MLGVLAFCVWENSQHCREAPRSTCKCSGKENTDSGPEGHVKLFAKTVKVDAFGMNKMQSKCIG